MNSQLNRIKDWAALAQNVRYSALGVSQQVGVSPRQLERYFQAHFGKSPHTWLRELRMSRAIELMCDNTPLKHVAFELCYKDAAHFNRDFKAYFGVSPGQYFLGKAVSGVVSCFDNKRRT